MRPIISTGSPARRGLVTPWLRGVVAVAAMLVVTTFTTIAAGQSSSGAAPGSGTRPVSAATPAEGLLDSLGVPVLSTLEFNLSDESGYWYDTGLTELEGVLHTRSLGLGVAGVTGKVAFHIGEPLTSENHTVSSIVWPEGAAGYPFVQQGASTGDLEAPLSEPGLYVFQCRVHPYMLGAVVNLSPDQAAVTLGKKVRWIDGTVMPTAAHEILAIVRSFFIVTEPANWQHYADHDTTWDPSYPAVPIMTYKEDGSPNLIPNLDAFYQEMFHEPITLKAPVKPAQPGVGEALVGTQWEHSAGKTKPSSLTFYDTETWAMTKKFFVPSVNMNNAHNFWSDKDGKFIYANNWFSNKMTTIDRQTGQVIHNVEVGPSPSHVMTRPDTDSLIIPNNGGNRIVELEPGGGKVVKSYLTQAPGQDPAFPHAHWISYDGKHVVTPNSNESKVSIFDISVPSMVKPESGGFPVASSMTNDGKRAYTSNLLDHTVTCHSIAAPACPTPEGRIVDIYQIDLRANYNKITGESTGPYALSPIQTPVSPDDSYMLGVGTFTANITVFDMKTNKLVKTLPCGPGCHGINFGLKKGGGWYGYVSIKFANKFIVVDGDPNGDGDPSDAMIAGELLTDVLSPGTKTDDRPTGNFGMGGNGVYAYPNPYNGWVQTMPPAWREKMTCKQQNPIAKSLC
ncbi:MAG: YncE family protein [Actinomycetota bacterium]